MFENKVLSRLPRHLLKLIIDQPYNSYTWQDHSVWRFVMRQNLDFLSEKAHPAYLDGLRKTGISIEQIPDIGTMNKILERTGWAAVTVDGFIPPAAFMEFQAYNVLVIAADIRPINQIEYTPAPDIIHEAAGHAPIIADADYSEYLKYFGEIGSKAFSSAADYALYEAIRYLSIVKADPHSPKELIQMAEQILEEKEKNLGIPSEMALIRNLHWWTVEYGLIGDLKNPKIYGAGLLSSIGESKGAMSEAVKKLPYNIDAVYYNFDITKPQPQLFVTPDFAHLTNVLDEFASRMALRKGGIEGVLKAIESASTATCEFSSGLQVSGTFKDYLLHQNQTIYIKTTGPTILCYQNSMLPGHGKEYHADGFGSPVGRIKNAYKPPRFLEDSDLMELGIGLDKMCEIEFESGLIVKGFLKSMTRRQGNLILMSFADCLVKYQDIILFEPSWGIYDMAVGESIVSSYTGPADPDGFGLEYPLPKEKTHKIVYDDKQKSLHQLYGLVRSVRENKSGFDQLSMILEKLKTDFPEDWLLGLEIAELCAGNDLDLRFTQEVSSFLNQRKTSSPEYSRLIERGQKLIATK
jgi:phenylalanine-4-hydroxylase